MMNIPGWSTVLFFFCLVFSTSLHFCGKHLDILLSDFQATLLCITVGVYMSNDFTKRHRYDIWNAEVSVWSLVGGFLPVTFLPQSCCKIFCAPFSSCLSPSKHLKIPSLSLSHLLICGYQPLPSSPHVLISSSHLPILAISPDPTGRVLFDLSTSNSSTTTLLFIILFPVLT